MAQKESIVLQPSQTILSYWLINAILSGIFLSIGLGIIIAIPLIIRSVQLSSTYYELFDDELKITTGVLWRETYTIKYFRIKSVWISEPLNQMALGLSTVNIISSDRFAPNVSLYAITEGERLKIVLDELTTEQRRLNNIKEQDLYF